MAPLDRYGGRRWLQANALIVIATGLALHGTLTGAQWVECMTWIFGLFVVGNVGQRGVEAARDVKAGAEAGR